ncbi:farnesyl pyrophosphate synthase-like isoform X1 [Leptopilina heterotoma]|uniref:farnesyl pyrophosphate synthase-like isoform X1 n=1 Tax=Leptopilina heterotoma TaxID=63436 RepID=UPI001CA95F7E|nr:farnesyl pyrophosphate synthase-like isoform X1 [Leptopilina heterotoma]
MLHIRMRKSMMTLCHKRLFSIRVLHNAPQKNIITNKDERQELMALWPNVVKDLTKFDGDLNIPEVTTRFSKLLQYNIPNGKMGRGISLINAYKELVPVEQLTDENIRLARILGWCCEIMHGYTLLEDDIMDRSLTRRGQPCWYLQDNVGLSAINDGQLLEQMIFKLLHMHFREKSYYLDLLETFHKIIYKILIGQSLDLLSTNCGKKRNFNFFTMDHYNTIVKYKSGYSTFLPSVMLAMNVAEIKDDEMFREAKNVLCEIGIFYQVQDDYLDCYGDQDITGKVGTDIQEGKCNWLIVSALERVTPEQRKILEECYGENDGEKSARVKELYHELKLQTIYNDYEEKKYNLIINQIKQKSPQLLQNLLLTILNSIYRRNK